MRRRSTRIVGAVGLAVIASYVVVVVVVTPVTFFVERYLLPMSPFIAAGLAGVLLEAGRRLAPSMCTSSVRGALFACAAMTAMIAALAGLGLSVVRPYGAASKASRAGDTLDAVVQRSAVDVVNHAAGPHATLLDYEVQDRYFLRSDLTLLALSGLTDGKVVPYLRRRELFPFLMRYRPTYWIVTDAITQRPSIADSDLGRVYETLKDHPKMRLITRQGIRFSVIARRNLEQIPGGWWRLILRIDYPGG